MHINQHFKYLQMELQGSYTSCLFTFNSYDFNHFIDVIENVTHWAIL